MALLTIPAPETEQEQNITSTTAVSIVNTTLTSIESNHQDESLYILIPFCSLLVIIILSLLVYLMASNRRRFVHMYCKTRQGRRTPNECNEYGSSLEQHFDAEEEEDELDTEDDPAKSLLRGKLQINNRFENYLSTSQLNRSSELFT